MSEAYVETQERRESSPVEDWIFYATEGLIPDARMRVGSEVRGHVAAMMTEEGVDEEAAVARLGDPAKVWRRYARLYLSWRQYRDIEAMLEERRMSQAEQLFELFLWVVTFTCGMQFCAYWLFTPLQDFDLTFAAITTGPTIFLAFNHLAPLALRYRYIELSAFLKSAYTCISFALATWIVFDYVEGLPASLTLIPLAVALFFSWDELQRARKLRRDPRPLEELILKSRIEWIGPAND